MRLNKPGEHERHYRPTILFLERDDSLRKALRSVFETLGYDVLIASGPLDALSLFRALPGEIRMIVCDVPMSDLAALRWCRAVRRESHAVKIAFCADRVSSSVFGALCKDKAVSILTEPQTLSRCLVALV